MKEDKGSKYVLVWKSKEFVKNERFLLHNAFLLNTGILLYSTPLVIDKDNYTIKIINAYIFYDLDYWPRNSLNSFTLKFCLFGAANTVELCDKNKCIYSGYGIKFRGDGSWSFGDGFSRNDVIFGVDNSSSSHLGNYKNCSLVLGEGPTDNINDSVDHAEKNFDINFIKHKQNYS